MRGWSSPLRDLLVRRERLRRIGRIQLPVLYGHLPSSPFFYCRRLHQATSYAYIYLSTIYYPDVMTAHSGD